MAMQADSDVQTGMPSAGLPGRVSSFANAVKRNPARKSVLLIANYRPDRQHSMLRYASWLSGALVKEGFNVRRIEPNPHLGLLFPNHPVLRKWLAYVDKFIIFPVKLLAMVRDYDVVHICDHGNAQYQQFTRDVPTIVTCHDLLAVRSSFGETESGEIGFTGRIFQKWILSSLKKIKYVCCVSEATEEDFLRLAGREGRYVKFIPQVLNYPFSRMPENLVQRTLARANFDFTQPFFMHIGNNSWYKNRVGVVELFAELGKKDAFKDFVLVLAGQELAPPLQERINALGISHKVRKIATPSSEVVRALYSRARALLFPSLQEGFGWPILEAQACGCPVITSDREPMRTVGGSAAFNIDPVDPVGSAERIAQHWDDIRSRSEASLRNLDRYSQTDARAAYMRLYRAAMSGATEAA